MRHFLLKRNPDIFSNSTDLNSIASHPAYSYIVAPIVTINRRVYCNSMTSHYVFDPEIIW